MFEEGGGGEGEFQPLLVIVAYPKQKTNVFGSQVLFGYLLIRKWRFFRLPFSDIVFGSASSRKRGSIF